jgi:hypothetical protein
MTASVTLTGHSCSYLFFLVLPFDRHGSRHISNTCSGYTNSCVCVCISIRAVVGQTKEENGGCSWDWEKGWPGKVGQTKEEEGVEGIEFSIHVSFN